MAERVSLERDDAAYKLLGESQYTSPTGPRHVSWLLDEANSTDMFVQGLAQAYGLPISTAVAREFALDPSPGRPLATRDAQAALNAAEVVWQAMAGVDFLTLLEYSASGGGMGFRRVAQEVGIDVSQLSTTVRQQIDARVRDRFAALGQAGEVPVSTEAMQLLLKKELILLTN